MKIKDVEKGKEEKKLVRKHFNCVGGEKWRQKDKRGIEVPRN